jgi:hypothetical protein
MRHTFATLALASGVDIAWISEQMGHEEIATTLRHYHKWLPSDLRNVNLLNAAHAAQTGLKSDSATTNATERVKPRNRQFQHLSLIGAVGLEPTTSSPPDWRANQAAPRPVAGRVYRSLVFFRGALPSEPT